MPTPRKVTQENWYDIFSEWSENDRAMALRVLEQTHRQLLKIEKKAPNAKPAQRALVVDPTKPHAFLSLDENNTPYVCKHCLFERESALHEVAE